MILLQFHTVFCTITLGNVLSYRKWEKQGQGDRRAFWFCGKRRMESAVYIAEKLLEYIRQFGIRQKIGLFFVADDAEMQKKQGGLGKGLESETLAKKKNTRVTHTLILI